MYSALKDNGTYYDSNPYNLSSASRLLVMGREAGNAMPDKGYTFWGDDNASLATYTSPTDSTSNFCQSRCLSNRLRGERED